MWGNKKSHTPQFAAVFSSLAENFNWGWNMNAQYISEKAPRR
jgi:hypothetical protein